MAEKWTCPNCGGNVTKDFDDYLKNIEKRNKATEGVADDAGTGVVTAEDPPKGGVGICSNCGQAVGAPGSKDAKLDEPPEGVQIPPDSPEHWDAPSGQTPEPVVVMDEEPAPESS